jgi:hypothetical protein
MPINDVFQANDWEIRCLLIIVLSLFFAFWGSISLDILGFSIPFLRQITGFLLLTFVPGILILRILRAHYLGAVRTTVYATGLSLATLMFTGFFVNIAYPIFGVYRPLSLAVDDHHQHSRWDPLPSCLGSRPGFRGTNSDKSP